MAQAILGCMLLGFLTVSLYYVVRWASLGAAYKAKLLCSGVFVARRDAGSILNADLAVDDLAMLRHIDSHVDYESKTVTAVFFGLVRRRAIYRRGLGCTLAYGNPEQRPCPAAGAEAIPNGAAKRPGPTAGPAADSPLSQGAGTSRLREAVESAFSDPDPARPRRTRAVLIVHDGRIVAERYAPGFTGETPFLGWSMAKSVVNSLVGTLVKKGRLSLDGPVAVPEWRKAGDRRRKITLDQLLHMNSGLRFDEDYGRPLTDVTRMLLGVPDMAAYAARKPLDGEPGTRWSYSSGTTNIIARILRDAVGDADYHAFPRRALFDRIGMRSAVIETDASGTFVGSSFMYASARDWARFGLLYLRDGVWANERLLPEGWVEYTRTPAAGDHRQRYGAHFWLEIPEEYRSGGSGSLLPPDSFHAIGHEGQFVTIIPSRDLVIVRLGLTRRPGAWDHGAFIASVLGGLSC